MARKYSLFERRLKRAVKKAIRLQGETAEKDLSQTARKPSAKQMRSLIRRQHLMMLSAPKAIRLRVWPDPELYVALPAPIARGTLTGRIPSRIEYLSRPKVRKSLAEIQEATVRPADTMKPNKKISYDRLYELSRPRAGRGRGVRPRGASGDVGEIPAQSKKSAPDQRWTEQQKWLEKNALPKRKMYQRPVEERPATPLKLSESRRADLIRRLHDDPVTKKLEKRSTAARAAGPKELKIKRDWVPDTASRIHALSKPKKLSPEARLDMDFDPYRIRRAVLRAKPSARVVALSAPRPRKTTNTDVKENAFQVSPAALRYKPTRRIRRLAEPIMR